MNSLRDHDQRAAWIEGIYMCTHMADQLTKERFGKKRVEQATMAEKAKQPTASAGSTATRSRYIPREIKFQVRQKAHGKCSCCGSTQNLQYDHLKPFALGGDSGVENIQMLCQSCNLRRGITTFGLQSMKRNGA